MSGGNMATGDNLRDDACARSVNATTCAPRDDKLLRVVDAFATLQKINLTC
jgi:hypothetical protein